MCKLLKIISLAALVCVLLSISVFAADSECIEHTWDNGVCTVCGYECSHPDGFGPQFDLGCHQCDICYFQVSCVDSDNDYYCDVCNQYLSLLALGGCLHMYNGSGLCAVLYADTDHYIYCLEDNCVVSMSGLYGPVFGDWSHTDDCQVCGQFSDSFQCLPYYLYERGVFKCSNLISFFEQSGLGEVSICSDETDHYLYCSDCGAYIEFAFIDGEPCPCMGSDCELCAKFSSAGFELLGPLPSGNSIVDVIDDTTTAVDASAGWVSTLASTISSHPLLLFSVILTFIGFGISIFRCLKS